MIITNKNMQKKIAKIKENKRPGKAEIFALIGLIWPVFEEVDGFILLKESDRKKTSLNVQLVLNNFRDRTEFEAFHNHVHLMDYINYFNKHPRKGLRFALTLMEIWECKLRKDFPNYTFHLILSFDGKDSILRVHRYREDEGNWIDINDLDGYKEEAIMVKVVN